MDANSKSIELSICALSQFMGQARDYEQYRVARIRGLQMQKYLPMLSPVSDGARVATDNGLKSGTCLTDSKNFSFSQSAR
jgi:hypothetical protein